MAAQRAGVKRVLLPRLNAKDIEELPGSVGQELEIILVDRIEEAIPLAISGFLKSSAGLTTQLVGHK